MIAGEKSESLAGSYARIDLGGYCVISIWFGCNNRCDVCMLSDFKGRLPAPGFERFKEIMLQIREKRVFRNLILSGAEVTVFNELEKYVEFAASLNWFEKIQIQTNGRRLSDWKYADRLVHCGVNEFFISLQGLEKNHDRTTGVPGSFAQTLKGVRNLENHDVNVISNTVLTRRNFRDILPLFSLMAREKMSEMHLWNFFPMGKSDPRDLVVKVTDFVQLLPGLLHIGHETGRPVVLKSFPECLSPGPPVFFDDCFPMTVLPDLFWRQFGECGFGQCFYREEKVCRQSLCWGLSSAYIDKYGYERDVLSPLKDECRRVQSGNPAE